MSNLLSVSNTGVGAGAAVVNDKDDVKINTVMNLKIHKKLYCSECIF